MENKTPEVERRIRMMDYVVRDKETDEIIGISPTAPADMKQEYEAYVAETESIEPIIR